MSPRRSVSSPSWMSGNIVSSGESRTWSRPRKWPNSCVPTSEIANSPPVASVHVVRSVVQKSWKP